MIRFLTAVLTLLIVLPAIGGLKQNRMKLYPDIQECIRTAVDEFDRIGESRKEKLKERPVISILEAPISPLLFPDVFIESLILGGEYGIPIEICSMPNVGGTGPITLAPPKKKHNSAKT